MILPFERIKPLSLLVKEAEREECHWLSSKDLAQLMLSAFQLVSLQLSLFGSFLVHL